MHIIKLKAKDMTNRLTEKELQEHIDQRKKGRQAHKSIKDYKRNKKHKQTELQKYNNNNY